jgi:hypothetical protein
MTSSTLPALRVATNLGGPLVGLGAPLVHGEHEPQHFAPNTVVFTGEKDPVAGWAPNLLPFGHFPEVVVGPVGAPILTRRWIALRDVHVREHGAPLYVTISLVVTHNVSYLVE